MPIGKATTETAEAGTVDFVTTPGQARFWLLDRLDPDNPRVNMALAFQLRGHVDVFALVQAVRALQARHEILRTTFHSVDGQLKQRIHQFLPCDLALADLSHVPEIDREAVLDAEKNAFARIRLDLEKGPPVAFRLLHVASDVHVVMVTLSHLVCDGWSNGVLLRDLAELYAAVVENRDADLPQLPVQYADYAECCDEWIREGGHDKGLQTLVHSIPLPESPLDLPADYARGAIASGGDIRTRLLAPELVDRLRRFCSAREMTLFEVLLAAFQVFVARYSGKEHFLISTLVANRAQAEVKDSIGLFANPQIISVRLSEELTGTELLDRVREWSLETHTHQQVPFELLLDALQADGRQMMLETSFLYQRAFMEPLEAGGLRFEPIRSVSPGAIYDLGLNVVERSEGPRLQMEYNPGLFRRETIEKMLSGYVAMLEHLLLCPDLPLAAAPVSGELYVRRSPRPATTQTAAAETRSGTVVDIGQPTHSESGSEWAIEIRMAEIWRRVLNRTAIPPMASVRELGVASLTIVRLLAEIRKEFGVALPITVFLSSPSIRSLSRRLHEMQAENDQPVRTLAAPFTGPEPEDTVVKLADGNGGPPIFCIYGVYLYGSLASQFAGEHTVYGVYQRMELRLLERGVWSDELKVLTKVESLAELYLAEIEKVQPEGPYYLVGESFGGLVAYEMAQLLTAKGQQVELLTLLDIPAPSYDRAKPLHVRLRLHASRFRTEGLPYLLARITPRLERVIDRLAGLFQRHRGHPPASGDQSLRGMERAQRDLRRTVRAQAMRSYRPKPYDGRVVLVRAMQTDAFVDPDCDPAWGWSPLVRNGLTVIDVPGDHLSILAEPNVAILADGLRECIKQEHVMSMPAAHRRTA